MRDQSRQIKRKNRDDSGNRARLLKYHIHVTRIGYSKQG